MPNAEIDKKDKLTGLLLGQLVGDALGLPREGLSPRRAAKLFGTEAEHHFCLGRGMMSDDTEHACIVGQSLLRSGLDDPSAFAQHLAWGLRWWLLGLPSGLGGATLKSTAKLWIGFPPDKSGVFSAGNGAAMRATLLGGVLEASGRFGSISEFVKSSTCITHTDPLAEFGALSVAMVSSYAMKEDPQKFSRVRALNYAIGPLTDNSGAPHGWFYKAMTLSQQPPTEFLEAIECPQGPTGYIFHTVAAAFWAFSGAPMDFREVMRRCFALGEDCDTVAAIAGAWCGALNGISAIPDEFLTRIADYPRSAAWVQDLGTRLAHLADSQAPGPQPLKWPALFPRNLLFLAVVMGHVFRRMMPPY